VGGHTSGLPERLEKKKRIMRWEEGRGRSKKEKGGYYRDGDRGFPRTSRTGISSETGGGELRPSKGKGKGKKESVCGPKEKMKNIVCDSI